MFCSHNQKRIIERCGPPKTLCKLLLWVISDSYDNKTVTVTQVKCQTYMVKVLWQELHSVQQCLWLVQYHVKETDACLSDLWWTIEGVWEVMHKVLRCIPLPCKQLEQDKRAFQCAAASGAGKSFWKIMTNITLSARQGEFDSCLSLTFISSLTKRRYTVLQYLLWGKDQIKGKRHSGLI